MDKIKERFRKELTNSAKVLGLVFGLAAFVVLLSGLFAAGRLGTMDTGKYEPVMEAAGLTYTEEDCQERETLTYDRVIETYDYTVFSYSKLFSPNGNSSIVYPIALIRLFTNTFGLDFSVVYLYIVYSLLASYGIYSLVRSSAWMAGKWAVIPGGLLLFVMSDRNLTAYFGSLYTTGTVILSLLLMTAMVLRLFTYAGKEGARGLGFYLVSVIFCLNASDISCVLIPFAVVTTGLILWYQRKLYSHRIITAVLAAGVLLSACYSSLTYFGSSPDIQSEASAYHAAFQGFLENSEDPVKDLEEFGLDESYAEDIGKSYYQEESDYIHNPRDEKEAELLFDRLNPQTIRRWYLKHPLRLLQTVMGQSENFNSFESGRVLDIDSRNSDKGKISRTWAVADMLMRLFLPENYQGANVLFVILSLLSVFTGIFLRKRGEGIRQSIVCGVDVWLWSAGIYFYTPVHVLYMGKDSLELARLYSVFAFVLAGSMVLMAGGKAAEFMAVWFRKTQNELCAPEEMEEWRVPLRSFRGHLQWKSSAKELWGRMISSRKATVLTVLAAALFMSVCVQFVGTRAGCVNNGDFGRMMEQLGITWEGDLYYDYQAQAGRGVIETYAYLGEFDWTSITFLNPKYSLAYPAAITRGICTLLGTPFSTWYMSILMNLVLVLCIVSIVRDLYGVLGKFTLPFGLGLCAVFLCESYLVWFNGLFGEGSIFLGVFLVVACSVHLSVLKEGKGWFYVFVLIFCARFLTCAKAQMLVALPFVLLLVIIFALYHRPLSLKGLIPYTIVVMLGCVLISYETVRVYQDNGDISERQTVWQSVFYGALMISEDPIADMEELGIDTRMAPDIGKHAYLPDEEYVISPNSEKADEAFYNHVNTFTMVKYYLKRPLKFLKMLNYAAGESRAMYNGFRVYVGQDYTAEHDIVQKLGLWLYWRPFFTFGFFWQYVVVYGGLLVGGFYGILRNRKMEKKKKLLFLVYVGIMLIGAIQYPLSVVGNGFADNHKQMFGFMLCHDLLVVSTLVFLIKYLWDHREEHLLIQMKEMLCKKLNVKIKSKLPKIQKEKQK